MKVTAKEASMLYVIPLVNYFMVVQVLGYSVIF